LPGFLREPVAISTACGAATAPILWFQFHAIPLLAVPANAAAAPAAVPLPGFAMAAAVVHPIAPGVGARLVQADGLGAACLAACGLGLSATARRYAAAGSGSADCRR